ncbi:hypothetical protein GF420_11760, partial [candidate division GN15 bacterium]|nr:hypothetical protein [candidate division GN15 bacterium]
MRLRDSIITVALLLVISGTAMLGCGGRPSLANMTADQLYEAGLKHYNEEKYLQSIDYFQAIVFNYPGESVVDTAQYYLALSYLG